MKLKYRKRAGVSLVPVLAGFAICQHLGAPIDKAVPKADTEKRIFDSTGSDSEFIKRIELSNNSNKRDFCFPNIDIRSAFKAVAAAGNIDIVLSPKITGRVTLRVSNKSWKQALAILCQMMNLKYSEEKEYIYVQSVSDFNKLEKEAPLLREIIKIKHSKVIDMKPVVQGMLSDRGKLTLVETANALILTDLPSKVDQIKEAVRTLDVETYQVHIQARIIELNSKDAQELGINWAYSSASAGGFQDASGNLAAKIPRSNDFVGVSSPSMVSNPSFSLAFGFLKGKLGGKIENLLSEGRGEVVAKPQITTLDNTEAKIFIGQKLPYNKLDDQYNATTEFVEAGIELVVTPHITNDSKIILDLAPQRSAANIDPVTRGPIVTTTEAKTTVVVDDGQTVVIGGLTSKTEDVIEKGIPFLKDIPLLGIFFKYKKKEIIKNDLVIFITPYIVKDQIPASRDVKSSSNNQKKPGKKHSESFPWNKEGLDNPGSDYDRKSVKKQRFHPPLASDTARSGGIEEDFPFFE